MDSIIKNSSWSDLESYYLNDHLFLIDKSVDLNMFIRVLEEDSVSYLHDWVENGLIVCPLPDEIELWKKHDNYEFSTIYLGDLAFIIIDI